MDKSKIDRRWVPFNALRAFESVAKHGSFTAAAAATHIAQSALSRHVGTIETLISTQLFERRPHSLILTKAGHHLLPAVTRSYDRLEQALNEIRTEKTTTLRTLQLHMPPSFALHLAMPILHEFRRVSPEVEINLLSPSGVGPPLSQVDAAVVYSKPMVTELITDLLWSEHLSILCHPRHAEQHAGLSLADFIAASELVHIRLSDQPLHQMWAQFVRHATTNRGNIERSLVVDTAVLAVKYALSGAGIALLDTKLFGEEIRSGALVKPFDITFEGGYGYYLVTDPEALSDTAIALFRSWLIERFGTSGTAGIT